MSKMQYILMTLVVSVLVLPHFHCGDAGNNKPIAEQADTALTIAHTPDFHLTENPGKEENWNLTVWQNLPQRESVGINYETKLKILYSDSGIYCLFHCEDKVISADLKEDFADLYNQDVVEAFFWPDESLPMYFEYELSPLNKELIILVPNIKGQFYGWAPWHYENGRRIKHAVLIEKKADSVQSWSAEFFLPFELLKPLVKQAPKKGTSWRANFYRIDYDSKPVSWTWQPVRDTSFHDYERFGRIRFN